MDEALLSRLDAIKDSIHVLDTKLTEIAAKQRASEDRHDRQQSEINELKSQVAALIALKDQGRGAALMGRLIWVAAMAATGLVGFLAGKH